MSRNKILSERLEHDMVARLACLHHIRAVMARTPAPNRINHAGLVKPYFVSTTGDSTSADKLEADGALIVRPSVYQSSKGILSE